MAVREANTPRRVLYRFGRPPDPLAFPPFEFTGGERFDDPQRQFRVLYAAEQRVACFVETLARFRPSVELLAAWRAMPEADVPEPPLPVGLVPRYWIASRQMVRLRLSSGQRWLDLRSFETREALRLELAGTLRVLGLSDLDVSGVRGSRRPLTQAIARWAYERGYHGIVYSSRFHDAYRCWAVFEGARFERSGRPQAITPRDRSLQAAMRLFGLQLATP
jgi:hypothetical protein